MIPNPNPLEVLTIQKSFGFFLPENLFGCGVQL
jgi:hypothetical protein